MKKKIVILGGIVVCSILTIFIGSYSNSNKIIIENDIDNSHVISTNALTMMYETEAGSGEYQISSDTTWPQEGYVFNETLSKCENGGILTWDNENKRVLLQTNSSDKCYVYFDVYVEPTLANICTSGANLASCIAEYNTLAGDGADGIYYHDGQGAYTNANQEAGDNSYRYSGANPNNYVCFGATGADCQDADNQYRIIGVFDNQVKLIKATSIGKYAWDADSVNTWNADTKPDIYTTLNTTYYGTLASEWQNLIVESIWQVGGFSSSDLGTAKEIYDVEVGTGQSGYEETMKIGLMYVSNYGYAASQEKWTLELNSASSNYRTDNWLYIDGASFEWTISRDSTNSSGAFFTAWYSDGAIIRNNVSGTASIYPAFYLASTATISSGSGTESDPFRIL